MIIEPIAKQGDQQLQEQQWQQVPFEKQFSYELIITKNMEYCWHVENSCAFRREVGTHDVMTKRNKTFTWANQPEDDPEKLDHDIFIASFPDGQTIEITDLTYGQLRGIIGGRKSQTAGEGPLWTGEHKTRHHKLTIEERDDREVLFSMTEQGKQIHQMHAERFGPLPPPKEGCIVSVVGNANSTMQAGLEFLKPLMIEYAEGKWSRGELKVACKEKADQSGIPKTLRAARLKNLGIKRQPWLLIRACTKKLKDEANAEVKDEVKEEAKEELEEGENKDQREADTGNAAARASTLTTGTTNRRKRSKVPESDEPEDAQPEAEKLPNTRITTARRPRRQRRRER